MTANVVGLERHVGLGDMLAYLAVRDGAAGGLPGYGELGGPVDRHPGGDYQPSF